MNHPSAPTLTLAIPYLNQLSATKGPMGLLKYNTSPTTEWLILDNGSSEPVEDFIRDTLRPKRLNYLKNPTNLGMVKTYQQIFDAVETDLVAILHNDVLIYQPDWDQYVIKEFDKNPKLGASALFGAAGCGPFGERLQDVQYPGQMSGVSNLLEAELHGQRLANPMPAAIFDGFAMIFRMSMIRAAGGLDQQYQFHHLYDRDLPLTSLSLGYQNCILPIPCHHLSGTTANQAEYQSWINQQLNSETADHDTHQTNSRYFMRKWSHALPLYINPDYSYRQGMFQKFHLKGDAILTAPKRKQENLHET